MDTNIWRDFQICISVPLTIKTPERCQWCRSGVFIVNFEPIYTLF